MINLFNWGLKVELIENLWVEIIKTFPAWIALIISLVLPFITKKLEIEKAQKLFIYQEKYKAYCEHFDKLCLYNKVLRTLLVHIKLHLDKNIENNEKFIETVENLYSSWDDVNRLESRLWLIAPNDVLEIKDELRKLVSKLNEKLNIFDSSITEVNFYELKTIAENIQQPLSEYLEQYRKELKTKQNK